MKRIKPRRKLLSFPILTALVAIATVLIGLSGFFLWHQWQPDPPLVGQTMASPNIVAPSPTPAQTPAEPMVSSQIPKTSTTPVAVQPTPTVSPATPGLPQSMTPRPIIPPPQQAYIPPVAQSYGHLRYGEASTGQLVPLSPQYYERTEYLIDTAAAAFGYMQAAAAQSGIKLVPISGFRSIADQVKLFDRQIKRRGSVAEAARLSAPPGYSEHHTGYALDIGDGNQPDADLKYEFDRTAAYEWLLSHAAQSYGFELSFPDNNKQGVSFEPWHWRYVGSPDASQIFAAAHQLF